MTGNWVLRFVFGGGNYDHVMSVINQNPDGSFSGTGAYPAGGSYTHTWTVTGEVNGDNISFHIVYLTGNPGYEAWVNGTIASDRTMSGTWYATGQPGPYEWRSISGAATRETITYKNHGQYVRSQENKQEAAQSRIGMPVQSKGHEK